MPWNCRGWIPKPIHHILRFFLVACHAAVRAYVLQPIGLCIVLSHTDATLLVRKYSSLTRLCTAQNRHSKIICYATKLFWDHDRPKWQQDVIVRFIKNQALSFQGNNQFGTAMAFDMLDRWCWHWCWYQKKLHCQKTRSEPWRGQDIREAMKYKWDGANKIGKKNGRPLIKLTAKVYTLTGKGSMASIIWLPESKILDVGRYRYLSRI